jgi:cytochrome c oxidase assembly protein subunit 15
MVTSGDDGMAVPDWPTTYGYNMFLYPVSTWLDGPWGVFIEHSHRLLGAAVGICSILLAVSLWLCGAPKSLRWLGLGLVAAVASQGVLGGMRVVMDERLLAKIHACTGPAVFALAVLATGLIGRWRTLSRDPADTRTDRLCVSDNEITGLRLWAYAAPVLAYSQLVLGAQLRHLAADSSVGVFRAVVVFHILLAVLLVVLAVGLAWRVRRVDATLRRPLRAAYWLAGCVLAQLLLGVGTWIVQYGWPYADTHVRWAAGYVVVAESSGQIFMTTAHVANGSLILALAVTVALNAAIALPATTLPPINEKQTSTKAKAARTPPFRLEVAR